MNLKIFLLSVLVVILQGCSLDTKNLLYKNKEVYIGEDLYNAQTYSENWQLKSLIHKSLQQDKKSFIELVDYNYGGGAGCYDLGSIIVQIIYRIGEENTIEMVKDLTPKQARYLHLLIGAGLEYGDNDYDEKPDNKLIENEFPVLEKTLRDLSKCEECL